MPGAWSRGRITNTPWFARRMPPSRLFASFENCVAASRARAAASALISVLRSLGRPQTPHHRRPAVRDPRLRRCEIVAGRHVGERPQREIRLGLAFRDALHRDELVTEARPDEAVADERSEE